MRLYMLLTILYKSKKTKQNKKNTKKTILYKSQFKNIDGAAHATYQTNSWVRLCATCLSMIKREIKVGNCVIIVFINMQVYVQAIQGQSQPQVRAKLKKKKKGFREFK